jgi:lactoylglutathione lyase
MTCSVSITTISSAEFGKPKISLRPVESNACVGVPWPCSFTNTFPDNRLYTPPLKIHLTSLNWVMPGSNVKQAVPFFRVFDIKKSMEYYVKGLGFKMTNEWVSDGHIQWCWLQHGDAGLMLQELEKEAVHKNDHKLGEGVSIYFICQDALALYLDFLSRGIEASEPFVGNGMWVVALSDPDGYNILFESYTDVAEETTYSAWRRSQ